LEALVIDLEGFGPRERIIVARLLERDLLELVDGLAVVFRVPLVDVIGRSRRVPVMRARQAVLSSFWAGGMTFKELGRLFDLHHTTVMHACRRAGGEPPALAKTARRALGIPTPQTRRTA
jgi:hypothetical protein